jgi:hypothetical protein
VDRARGNSVEPQIMIHGDSGPVEGGLGGRVGQGWHGIEVPVTRVPPVGIERAVRVQLANEDAAPATGAEARASYLGWWRGEVARELGAFSGY